MGVDITLLGATGFTGSLTAQHLAEHLPSDAKWTIAGRDRSKLERLAAKFRGPGLNEPSVAVVDLANERAMAKLASETRVLISTIGPYLQHGEHAVRAAANAGIAYVDLTGEPQFVDEMWLKYHETALKTGATLVHACGFDSIPYDLGVLHTVRELPEGVPITVHGYIRASASFSGGTYHSALEQMGSLVSARRAARKRRKKESRPRGRKISGGAKVSPAVDPIPGWGAPLPTIDPIIVLRSARALDRYGPEFTYRHHAHFHTRRMMLAAGPATGAVVLGAQLPPLRAAMKKLTNAGSGPSPEKREQSWFKLSLVGEGGGRRVLTTVSGGDPGYTETAKMLAESAMCLAFDELPRVAGQTTTAVAMGAD